MSSHGRPQMNSKLGDESRTPFWGIKTPLEIKVMAKSLKDVKKPTFRKLLKAAVSYIESPEIPSDFLDAINGETNIPSETVASIFSGILSILKAAFRVPPTSLRQEAFKSDLKSLRMPEEFIEDLTSAVYGAKRNAIDETLSNPSSKLPGLERLRWRVDVAISNSALSRVLEPTVFMEITLSDGSMKKVEVPMTKFHELRYNVSSVLKEMEELEKRSILKIQD
ncbi:COMM domain-containing protein 5 [Holothuria leucospilota]|uniref:COMM domain-containing protein 5 n=1 Tax=Holothuria leucospilota TaxID=206669 RepID=A0A9Q1BKA7_HOLLE|nr:COMM domain-containing protein 5 [Holothuria leucospilota]